MIIGHNILVSKAIPFLKELPCDSLFFVIDDACYSALPDDFVSFIATYPSLRLEIVSEDKDTALLARVWDWLHNEGASRKSVLVLIGGGTLTDVGGFAAATYMRGIRTVNITTTLLGMVDASVGGKTAIDFGGVKNLIGAFHLPEEVIVDTLFLDTLPINEIYSGFGEVIKTGLLSGPDLWHKVCTCEPQQMLGEDWLELISRCIEYKAEIVSLDPEERNGKRAVLNLGHTVGHALETFSREVTYGRPLMHGEAVVIGLIVESYLAYKHLGLDLSILRTLMGLAREHYPQYQYVCKAYPRLIELMKMDKKSSNQVIRFALLTKLGEAEVWQTDNTALIEEALDFYREAFGG